MSQKIAKSPEMIAKEAEVKALVVKIKKSRTTLKSLKTRLKNSQQNFVQYQMQMQTEVLSRMQKVSEVLNDLRAYAEKLKTAKFLSKEDRLALDSILRELSVDALFGEGYEEFQEKRAKAERGEHDFEEEARAKAHDIFNEFNVEPEADEKRKIRQVFIALSSKLHPDKAKNDKEREDFHVLMQEVNAAYKSNDIDKLLEMERLYLHAETIDLTGKAVTVDVLTEEVNRLQRELDFIENQISRTSTEIKNFRKSDLGKALTSAKKAEKEGEGVDSDAAQLEEMLTQMTKFRDALKDTWEEKGISDSLMELIGGPFGGNPFDMFDDDDDDFFGNFFDDDDDTNLSDLMSMFGSEPLKNPKFKDYQSVLVAQSVISDVVQDVDMKGWTGYVVDSYLVGDTEYYEVEFDIPTLSKMSDDFIRISLEDGEEFGVFAFEKEDLKKKNTKYDYDEIDEFRNRLTIDYKFADYPKNVREIIVEAMSYGEEDEIENWEIYLHNHLKLPLDTKARGHVDGMRKGTKMKIINIPMAHPMYGIIAQVLKGKERMPHPLLDLAVSKTADKKFGLMLDAYVAWARQEYGG